MDIYAATETAYRNGYSAGIKKAKSEIVYCRECMYWKAVETLMGEMMGCVAQNDMVSFKDGADYCSWGERK